MRLAALFTLAFVVVVAVPSASRAAEGLSHTNKGCTLNQCMCGIPNPWEGYCQEKKHGSSCRCGIFRGTLFGRRSDCGAAGHGGCSDCQNHGSHGADDYARRPAPQLRGVADLSARPVRDGRGAGHSTDRHRVNQRVRNAAAQLQPLPVATSNAIPHNNLPVNGTRRSLENHLPSTNEAAHLRPEAADLHRHDAVGDSHTHTVATDSGNRCHRTRGPDLFFHFLGWKCPTDSCGTCGDHSHDVTSNAVHANDASLPAAI